MKTWGEVGSFRVVGSGAAAIGGVSRDTSPLLTGALRSLMRLLICSIYFYFSVAIATYFRRNSFGKT